MFIEYEKPFLILGAVFEVTVSTLVIVSDPRLCLGPESKTCVENATSNAAPRIRNSTSNLFLLYDLNLLTGLFFFTVIIL